MIFCHDLDKLGRCLERGNLNMPRMKMRISKRARMRINKLNLKELLFSRFSNPNRSLNRKNERFKIFEVDPGSNRDNVIINLIII